MLNASPDANVQFTVYARLWIFTEVLMHIHDPFLIPHPAWAYVQMLLFPIAFFWPTQTTMVLAMLARCGQYWCRLPYIWDSCVWALLTDAVFICAAALCSTPAATVIARGDLIRKQMAFFYIGAGLWKINTSFLDARVSCASIYVASLIAFLPPRLTPPWLVKPTKTLKHCRTYAPN